MLKDKSIKYPKLLLIEDDILISKSMNVIFESANYVVKVVKSAEEARELLRPFGPSAIILDLVLPQKDGLTFLKELRESKEWKHIPVIITSNMAEEENIDKAYLLSAAEYIVKSDLSLSDLVSKVTKHINLSTYAQSTLV